MGVDLVLLSGVSYRGQEIAGHRTRDLLALLAADLRTGRGTSRLVEPPTGAPDDGDLAADATQHLRTRSQ